jgi:hypothetical protein
MDLVLGSFNEDANGVSNAYLKYLCEFSKSCPISTDFIICANLSIWVAGIGTVYYGWRKPFVGALFSGYLVFEALAHNISFVKTFNYNPGIYLLI